VDVAQIISHRLKELGFEQKELAIAAEVTESYISQLLARKKAPPAPDRTDIYDKVERFLRLPSGKLSTLASIQRREDLRKKVADPPAPLFQDFRELILRKCEPRRRSQVRAIFEKEPFGELERLVTQKLLDVAKGVAREELNSEKWLRATARLGKRSYEQMRVAILEFLDTDIFHVSMENCVAFLEPLVENWDIDLDTFGIVVALNRKLTAPNVKRFEFVERTPTVVEKSAGLLEFLQSPGLSGDASREELEILESLRFNGRQPTALYYYRELQSLRDPLHFRLQGQLKR
jgi:transcriptional regulator with XRE-family HTH domain